MRSHVVEEHKAHSYKFCTCDVWHVNFLRMRSKDKLILLTVCLFQDIAEKQMRSHVVEEHKAHS
jgi:hypothetical protein